MKQTVWLFLFTAVLASCTSRRPTGRGEGTAVSFRYAQLIHVETYDDGSRLVRIDNPWKEGQTLHRYLLVPYGAVVQHQTEQGTTVVRTPLRRSVIFTSVHAALVCELQAQEQMAGVADAKYMKVPYVQQGIADGRLADCGDGMSPLIEKIIDAGADAILLSPFENSGGYGRLEDIDIPLIECAEYMEHSPLARAEWMRFYGMLYGQEQQADSLFAVVDSCYRALCREAEDLGRGRSTLLDKQTGSVWYVPGGRSTIGQMLVDAGADYPFAADDHSGSLALPFEAMLERAGESDVWLLRYDAADSLTLSSLLSEQPGYKQLRSVHEGQVYACNVATSMFYEESPFRPDLLLRDFIQIIHPDIPNPAPLRYYHKVK